MKGSDVVDLAVEKSTILQNCMPQKSPSYGLEHFVALISLRNGTSHKRLCGNRRKIDSAKIELRKLIARKLKANEN